MTSRVINGITVYIQRKLTQRSSVLFYADIVPKFCVNGSSLLGIVQDVVDGGCGGRFVAIGAFSPEDLSYEWFIGERDNMKKRVALIEKKGFEVDDFFERGERFDYYTGEKTDGLSTPPELKKRRYLFP